MDHVVHVIRARIAVGSPDSAQPEVHAGSYSAVPGNALGETGVMAGIEGVLTGPAVDAVPRGADF